MIAFVTICVALLATVDMFVAHDFRSLERGLRAVAGGNVLLLRQSQLVVMALRAPSAPPLPLFLPLLLSLAAASPPHAHLTPILRAGSRS